MSIFSRIFGNHSSRVIAQYDDVVAHINAEEGVLRELSDSELTQKTDGFRARLAKGESVDNTLAEAFAVVREAARRTLGQRHYDVQLVGGIVLHRGAISEMHTGEGKTLVATLPAYLNALSGKGVHVVTVNDYLARRDGVWMGQIYALLGLSVAVINHDSSYRYDAGHTEADAARDESGSYKIFYEFLKPCSRKEAYAADITYGTNNEFGFDYLRDNLAHDPSLLVQREYHYAIVDEIDSVLIDEARTPLIISAPVAQSDSLYSTFASIARSFTRDVHYTVDEKRREIAMTESGIEQAEKSLGVENIYTEKGIRFVHHLETAVRAEALYLLDRDYVVQDGEVIIVDQFTGRLQPGRRWSEGLHQAIEAKEGVKVREESRTFATISLQNYFRQYAKLSGMTGTASTSAEEFRRVYGLDVITIPTNKPVVREDRPDVIFQTEQGKWQALVRTIKELQAKGQPVLVGTVSVEKSEHLASMLSREGVEHAVLNAKKHEQEGAVIADAGRIGAVTIATNMAGRGVDIKLGGALADTSTYERVKALGGLFVIGTERHDARRIDNQLRGRSGRQGDPGETRFFLSLEDSLMRIFASDTVKKLMGTFGIPEDEAIESRLVSRSIEAAQTKVEGFNFDGRRYLLEYDDVMNTQRRSIYGRRRRALNGNHADLEELFAEIIEHENEMSSFAITAEKKRTELGEEVFWAMFRRLYMQVIDMLWVEHLEAMEHLRGSVRLRAYGQRDPLVEYKRDALRMFKAMERMLFSSLAEYIPRLAPEGIREETPAGLKEVHEAAKSIGDAPRAAETHIVSPSRTVAGRNDPCPCGSGKKFKKCHGK
ncbi:MAG: preprotein translocase subunit SecA [Candidatus Vogelbacteria bacterium]|nr:preprotein translocase subunit SecA [Candidatus Vogelbacteria bacterium]